MNDKEATRKSGRLLFVVACRVAAVWDGNEEGAATLLRRPRFVASRRQGLLLLGGDALQPLQHAEHDAHSDEADDGEDGPGHPEAGQLVEEEGSDHDEQVAHGGGGEPQALADALDMLGGNLGDEAQTHRRDEELGHGEEEVGDDEHPCVGFHAGDGGGVLLHEGFTRGITHVHAEDGEEDVGAGSEEHADDNLARSGELAAPRGAEEPHDDRREQDDEGGVEELPHLGCHAVGVDEVAGEQRERLAVLVERHPEEDADAQHGVETGHALADVLGHCLALFGGVLHHLGFGLLGGSGEHLLENHENQQGDEHGGHRGQEGIVDTGVEDLQVALAGGLHVGRVEVGVVLAHPGGEVGHLGGVHAGGIAEVLMAEGGQVAIVGHAVAAQPPLAQRRSHEGSQHTADIDEHVEDLESRITLALSQGQSLGALLGGLGFEVVVHLAHNGLQVALEEAVAAGNDQQGGAGDDQHRRHRHAVGAVAGRNRQHHIADGHGDQAGDDGALVVLQLVGDDTAGQSHHVDAEIEDGVDDGRHIVADAKLRAEEEQQYGIHNIVAEALAHITQCRRD